MSDYSIIQSEVEFSDIVRRNCKMRERETRKQNLRTIVSLLYLSLLCIFLTSTILITSIIKIEGKNLDNGETCLFNLQCSSKYCYYSAWFNFTCT